MPGRRLSSDDELRQLLEDVHTIAVIGLSPKLHRPSHQVSKYMRDAGYRIIPVRPAVDQIFGEKAYPRLDAIPRSIQIDLVNVFRRPSALPDLVPEATAVSPKAIWFQLGVTHDAAEEDAMDRGVDLVVDRCLLVEHRRLLAR